ncbi:hypothetical protein BDZ85DRAFT_257436 [Elsinoe ampelina]|uniref:Uncharacterized protein n=1 Tax=Elsinoe ampelina TaxID=302913 RepID=A0A6A6GIC4_9PEZI|nr:hypothetical protein BDZ85DRAFT_257436 [Elsinoe ampelina]
MIIFAVIASVLAVLAIRHHRKVESISVVNLVLKSITSTLRLADFDTPPGSFSESSQQALWAIFAGQEFTDEQALSQFLSGTPSSDSTRTEPKALQRPRETSRRRSTGWSERLISTTSRCTTTSSSSSGRQSLTRLRKDQQRLWRSRHCSGI